MTMYLALKTDQAEVELYLLTSDGEIVKQKIWLADRELARDLPGEIDALLGGKYEELKGIIVFKGPGSFTGLRIGAAVANAIVPLYAPNAVNAPPAKPVPAPIPALVTKETCFSIFFNTTVLKSFKFKFSKLPSC